jgi:hypothetical protein
MIFLFFLGILYGDLQVLEPRHRELHLRRALRAQALLLRCLMRLNLGGVLAQVLGDSILKDLHNEFFGNDLGGRGCWRRLLQHGLEHFLLDKVRQVGHILRRRILTIRGGAGRALVERRGQAAVAPGGVGAIASSLAPAAAGRQQRPVLIHRRQVRRRGRRRLLLLEPPHLGECLGVGLLRHIPDGSGVRLDRLEGALGEVHTRLDGRSPVLGTGFVIHPDIPARRVAVHIHLLLVRLTEFRLAVCPTSLHRLMRALRADAIPPHTAAAVPVMERRELTGRLRQDVRRGIDAHIGRQGDLDLLDAFLARFGDLALGRRVSAQLGELGCLLVHREFHLRHHLHHLRHLGGVVAHP